MQLVKDLGTLFNQACDDNDYYTDVEDLKLQQDDFLRIIFEVRHSDLKQDMGQNIDQEKEKLNQLIENQTTQRNTYKSIRNPTAELKIENAQLTFLSVIGKGGFGVVWKGLFEGNTVILVELGGYKENFCLVSIAKYYRVFLVGS